MLLRLLSLSCTAALLCCTGCGSVRTVYDSQGNVVTDAPGGEKDLMTSYEKKFNSSFTVKKTADGVPQTVSNKTSPFQRDIDNARKNKEQYSTKGFYAGSNSMFNGKSFNGAGKGFNFSRSDIQRSRNSMFSSHSQPDFMNESHGISHSNAFIANAASRSHMEGKGVNTNRYYMSGGSPYSASDISNYIERNRNKTPQPDIIDHQESYQQYREGIRGLLGRDNEAY